MPTFGNAEIPDRRHLAGVAAALLAQQRVCEQPVRH